MKPAIFALAALAAALAYAAAPARAQQPGEFYVLPETIKKTADIVGLTEIEREALTAVAERAEELLAAARVSARRAEEAARAAVRADPLDADAVLPLFDALLAAETEIKRLELEVLVELNRLLTADQRKAMMDLQAAHAKFGGPIDAKVAEIRALADSGKVPQEVLDGVEAEGESIKAMAEQGKFAEADAALTDLLARLREAAGN